MTLATTEKIQLRPNSTGSRNAQSKLTEEDVRLMLALHFYHGLNPAQLAEKFDVSYTCARKVCIRETWIHV